MTTPAFVHATHRQVERLTPGGALLGESPRWDDRTGRLVWVDLWGGLLHATSPGETAKTANTVTTEIAPPLSAAVLSASGSLVVAQGLCVLEITDGGTRHLVDLPEQGCMRANDAAVDAVGRLWIGTMYLPGRVGAPGGLWRWEPGAAPVRVLDDLALANGIAWSPEGDRMYLVDSLRQVVSAYPYDGARGSVGPAERFVDVPGEDGLPDGLTVAADGSVWVALAGGGAVHRYTPEGELSERVALPVQFPTSCTFGGPDLTDLFVTTGSRQVPREQRASAVASGAGALYRVATHTPGLPTHRLELS
jgi:sugar lactone lactonase YvrE